MNRNYYIFIGQILAAIRGNKQFFVSKHSKTTFELTSIFKKLNIIKHVTEPSDKIIRNMPRTYRQKYKIFWLNDTRHSSEANKIFFNGPKGSNWSRNKWYFNRIKIVKPGVFHKNILSYKELKNIKPHWNTIYIMQTSKGFITSKEALRYKVGGFVICIIYL